MFLLSNIIQCISETRRGDQMVAPFYFSFMQAPVYFKTGTSRFSETMSTTGSVGIFVRP